MKTVIEFLRKLAANNNREWFNTHKDLYIKAKQHFDNFVEALIPRIREVDPTIGPLTVADCTWRIYRDTRFSADKTPYKTHMGCYFAPRGKKGPFSGYYFHVEVDSDGNTRGLLATGNYFTTPAVLRILREDIEIDEGAALDAALARAKGFSLDTDQMLKRPARGFNPDKPFSHYFRYKNFCLIKNLPASFFDKPDLTSKIVAEFARTTPFLSLLNRAVSYTIENPE